ALAAASRPSPLELEAVRARRPAHAWQALPGLRSVRRPRPPATRNARAARAMASNDRRQPSADRRARPEIGECGAELRRLGAEHRRHVALLMTVPGIGWVLACTITSELGDIHRFPTPRNLTGYNGLCPRVYQSGDRDLRGPLSKQGPRYLRSALARRQGRPDR